MPTDDTIPRPPCSASPPPQQQKSSLKLEPSNSTALVTDMKMMTLEEGKSGKGTGRDTVDRKNNNCMFTITDNANFLAVNICHGRKSERSTAKQ